ncbi:MAG TPA: methyltransferase domain-containing protein [Acidobacteriaceae bacterium]|nr:methyltransferase domain-containing protein [Acidobacteriaceae bacterium]
MTQTGDSGRSCENAMAGMTERERWNAKFLAGEAQKTEPNQRVVEACSGLTPGRALDLAGGAGRHAIWLAQRGWQATLADVADEGLAVAQRRAEAHGIAVVPEGSEAQSARSGSITLRREEAAETVAWARSAHRFDLIVAVRVLLRDLFDELPGLLAPNGLLVMMTFTSEHARFADGKSTRYALRPGELGAAFPALKTILYREENGEAALVARAESSALAEAHAGPG